MSMKRIKSTFSTLELHTEDIIDLIDESEMERRKEAAKAVSKIMKKNVSRKGTSSPGAYPGYRTGTTKRKIGYKMLKADRSVVVGTKDFKAHLLEFGHGDGKNKNKRPFIFRTFRENRHVIERIMSERYF